MLKLIRARLESGQKQHVIKMMDIRFTRKLVILAPNLIGYIRDVLISYFSTFWLDDLKNSMICHIPS